MDIKPKTGDLFLKMAPDDPGYKWEEWHLQAYIIMKSRRAGLRVHGDQNGVSKTPRGMSMGAVTGMLSGWPDLCYILKSGPLWIELKCDRMKDSKLIKGATSKEQTGLHDWMRLCGCRVRICRGQTPWEAWLETVAELAIAGEIVDPWVMMAKA